MAVSIKALADSLVEDNWRLDNPFSEDIVQANRVLLHPFAKDSERKKTLSAWLQRHQTCRFGRIAAAIDQMHYCILTNDNIRDTDAEIANKIQRERLIWKQQAVTKPKHGFMLVVASERVLCAAPDENLKAFSEGIRSLWQLSIAPNENGNDVSADLVYLKNPATGGYLGYEMNIDYFSAAGDRRWWHDHRIPGGLAFTANSLGHMLRYREWYDGKVNQEDWGTRTSMLTIDAAKQTEHDRATWLIPLENKKSKCPFANPDELPEVLKNKDWSAYKGTLHTDHSIRSEFFDGKVEPAHSNAPWLMDFTYIFDPSEPDFQKMSAGVPVTDEVIYAELGKPEKWDVSQPAEPMAIIRTRLQTQELRQGLAICEQWELTAEELQELD